MFDFIAPQAARHAAVRRPHVVGSVVRRGTELLRIEGEFVDPVPLEPSSAGLPYPASSAVDIQGRSCGKLVSFNFLVADARRR